MKKNNWISILTAILLFTILCFSYETRIIGSMDEVTFNFFEAVRTDTLDKFGFFLRDFGASKMYLTFAVILLIYSIIQKRIWAGIYIIVTLLTGRILVNVLKNLFERPRPTTMYYIEDGFSFPSGHAVMATCFFLSLSFILLILDHRLLKQKRIIATVCIMMIILISFSRIYLHVHHLSDILAGWLVGYVWYSICKNSLIYLHERKQL